MNYLYIYTIILVIIYSISFSYLWYRIQPQPYANLSPSLDVYLADPVSLTSSLHSFYHLAIYKAPLMDNSYMLYIAPQAYHFFIENGSIVYHPFNTNDSVLKHYTCPPSFEPAYSIPLEKKLGFMNPTVICHRRLRYLQKHVYTDRIYLKTFDTLQKPMNALAAVFKVGYCFEKILADKIKNKK